MKDLIKKIKNYIKKLKKINNINFIKKVKENSEDLFNIIELNNKPVLTFNGVVITTPDECDIKTLVSKMFTLRNIYVNSHISKL